ncbi:MAG: flagellar hook-basal body protein [Caulobacterales bacterium]
MTGAFDIGAVGLVAQKQALDVIANNIANINTPAFKRSDVRFSEVMATRADNANPSARLTQDPALSGVSAQSFLNITGQGQIDRTDNPLDLAIEGEGFIELMGPGGQTLLWRGGVLRVGEDGLLSAGDGLPMRAMIAVPAGASALTVAPDGRVSARVDGADQATEIGRLLLVRPENTNALERLDGGFYRLNDGNRLEELAAGEDGIGAFVQGAVERSNVELNDEMVRLMIVQRAYAANAQIVQAADQMMAIANGLRR